MVGGGLFVAVPYWYLYLWGEEVVVGFDIGAIASAEQAGGPLGPSPAKDFNARHLIHGREIDHQHPAHHLPSSHVNMPSGISRELNGEKFGASPSAKDPERGSENASESEKTITQ